jgi:hypothetical protein
MPYDTPQLGSPGPVGDGEYTVIQGDCLESIAFEAGRLWKTIWDHPSNAALKKARGCPNVLLPGDCIHIPDIALKTVERPTDQKHVFVRKSLTSKLKFCIKQVGQPRRNEPYRLEVDAKLFKGKTDGNGCIEVAIAPNARGGTLTVGDRGWNQQIIPIELGGMDPITEVIGVQKRLQNLGFPCEPTGGMDDETSAVIAMFQKAEDLEPTGRLDQTTIEKIKTRYGS